MVIPGRVLNGVVVLEGGTPLPEGAAVTVTFPAPPPTTGEKKRVEVPLVRGGEPGSLHLTNEMIAEIFDGEDASRIMRYFPGGSGQQNEETSVDEDASPRR